MKYFLACFAFLFCIQNSLALQAEAYPKGGNFENSRMVMLKSDDPNAKILWTRDPYAPPDETFIYHGPIPVHYTQEIWFFAFNSENEVTPFYKEKYTIRANPNRYSKHVFISAFSPEKQFIQLTNDGNEDILLKDWKLEGRMGKIDLENITIRAGSSVQIETPMAKFLDKIILRSPDLFVKDVMRYNNTFSDETKVIFPRKKHEYFIKTNEID